MNESKVFISHRRADSFLAEKWHQFLTSCGIDCYLDVLDPTTQELAGREISKYLHSHLRRCTHLLVLFTDNTSGSMWVPFEIGLATERDLGIAIHRFRKLKLPEYLWEWPILDKDSDYYAFADLIRRESSLRQRSKSVGERYSDLFHRTLKLEIGQMR